MVKPASGPHCFCGLAPSVNWLLQQEHLGPYREDEYDYTLIQYKSLSGTGSD